MIFESLISDVEMVYSWFFTPLLLTGLVSLAAKSFAILSLNAREPLINEVGEWNRESRHLGFSD